MYKGIVWIRSAVYKINEKGEILPDLIDQGQHEPYDTIIFNDEIDAKNKVKEAMVNIRRKIKEELHGETR